MNTYTLFWKHGDREIVKGDTPANAMTLAGYGGGTIKALDFYANGDNDEYQWNKETHEWDLKDVKDRIDYEKTR